MRIALLGLGKMGLPLARVLLQHGHPLTVWNRTATTADQLIEGGARVAGTAEEAVTGLPVVLTLLSDDAATTAVVLGTEHKPGVLRAMAADAVHVSLSTISVGLSRRLAEEHRHHGQHFVAAPVFGRPHVAEQGKLWIAVAGSPPSVERVLPVLRSASRGISVVSEEPWRAHALKLGGNFMIAAMIQAMSEAFVFAASQGVAPELFMETVNSALFQSAFCTQYCQTILHPPPLPGATVALGSKDISLFREAAAEAHRQLPMADCIAQQLRRAEQAGMKDEEWAVGQYRMAQSVAMDSFTEQLPTEPMPGSGEKG